MVLPPQENGEGAKTPASPASALCTSAASGKKPLQEAPSPLPKDMRSEPKGMVSGSWAAGARFALRLSPVGLLLPDPGAVGVLGADGEAVGGVGGEGDRGAEAGRCEEAEFEGCFLHCCGWLGG